MAKKEKPEKIEKPKKIKKPKNTEKPEKIEKPKKIKKPLSKKISGINTTSAISYGNVESNPKDKRVKWIFGASIIALLGLGIGLPVGLGWNDYNSRKALPLGDDVTPGITVGDMVENNKDNDKLKKDAEKIENIIVEKLYKEERDAFLKFQAFVNNTKYKGTNETVGSTSFGLDVSKSFKDVRKAQSDKLDAAKKAMRESDPVNWSEKWKKELKTNTLYGGANTDKEAIDFMTKNIVKNAAFARFNTSEINTTSWTQQDLSLQAEQDIKYKDDEGVTQTIVAGTQLFSSPFSTPSLNTKENFLSATGNNIAIPSKRDPIKPSKEIKIAVYQTKSYVLHERNPLNRLPTIYDQYYKSANISSLSLAINQDPKSPKIPWIITKEILINLFTMRRTEGGSLIVPFNNISNFKGANTNSTIKQKETDKAVLNILSSSNNEGGGETPPSTKAEATTGSQLGSSKVTSLATMIKSEENESRAFNVAAISAQDTPTEDAGIYKIKKSNPLNILLTKILKIDVTATSIVNPLIQEFVKFLTASLNPTFSTTDSSVTFAPSLDFNIFEYNNDLKEKINLIDDSPFKVFFGNLVKESFYDNNPYAGTADLPGKEDWKKWTVYELSAGTSPTYLYVDDKGLKIYNIQYVSGVETPKQMLKSDIQNTIDVGENPDQVVLYDISAQYNKIANNNIINKILIEENHADIIATLIKDDATLDQVKAQEMLTGVYQFILGNINNIIDPEIKSALTDIPKFVEQQIKPMNSYDFQQIKGLGPVQINLYNGFNYVNAGLESLTLIQAQFYNKLSKIISIVATPGKESK